MGLQFITSRDRPHLRRAYSDKQRRRLLNWIDEIKLSHQSGSKLRDNLNLDDRNLFKMRNLGTVTDDVDPELEVGWDTVKTSIDKQPEEDNWTDEALLPQE